MSTFKEKLARDRRKHREEKTAQASAQRAKERQRAEASRQYEERTTAEQAESNRKVQRWRKIVKKPLCELTEETIADGRMPKGFSFIEEVSPAEG